MTPIEMVTTMTTMAMTANLPVRVSACMPSRLSLYFAKSQEDEDVDETP
jgi:hypothetical protein